LIKVKWAPEIIGVFVCIFERGGNGNVGLELGMSGFVFNAKAGGGGSIS